MHINSPPHSIHPSFGRPPSSRLPVTWNSRVLVAAFPLHTKFSVLWVHLSSFSSPISPSTSILTTPNFPFLFPPRSLHFIVRFWILNLLLSIFPLLSLELYISVHGRLIFSEDICNCFPPAISSNFLYPRLLFSFFLHVLFPIYKLIFSFH